MELLDVDLDELLSRAHDVRLKRRSGVELCSIINAKSGGCTEDCAFCTQSSFSGSFNMGEILPGWGCAKGA